MRHDSRRTICGGFSSYPHVEARTTGRYHRQRPPSPCPPTRRTRSTDTANSITATAPHATTICPRTDRPRNSAPTASPRQNHRPRQKLRINRLAQAPRLTSQRTHATPVLISAPTILILYPRTDNPPTILPQTPSKLQSPQINESDTRQKSSPTPIFHITILLHHQIAPELIPKSISPAQS